MFRICCILWLPHRTICPLTYSATATDSPQYSAFSLSPAPRQRLPANSSKPPTVATSPCRERTSKYASTEYGGCFKRARTLLTAAQNSSGASFIWSHKKTSGCCASIPKGASTAAGKSFNPSYSPDRVYRGGERSLTLWSDVENGCRRHSIHPDRKCHACHVRW